MENLTQHLRVFIDETFLFGQGIDELQDDDSFIDKGVIDSTGVLQLVGFIEETCSIRVEDEELIPDNLDSISRVRSFVERKQAQAAQKTAVSAMAAQGARW